VRLLKFALAAALALLPSALKIPAYRLLFGYRIGKGVWIGFSPFVGVRRCSIGDHARVGHGNLFYEVADLEIGGHARIGFLNMFRGGKRLIIGPFATILRQNVFNAIIDQDFDDEVESVLELGQGCSVAAGHWLDFSAGISIGDQTMIAGRNSTLWSHFRQRGGPIRIGHHCYIGSESRVTAGVSIPPLSIVTIGSVVLNPFERPRFLIGGNPAKQIRALNDHELAAVIRKTRRDIPDEFVLGSLPPDLHELYGQTIRPAGSPAAGPR
jgi:acetyltransferase-like isoleucine patch superfamily enzyme